MERAHLWATHWKGRGGWIQFDSVVGLVVGGMGGLPLGARGAQESLERSLRESQQGARNNGLEKCHFDHLGN